MRRRFYIPVDQHSGPKGKLLHPSFIKQAKTWKTDLEELAEVNEGMIPWDQFKPCVYLLNCDRLYKIGFTTNLKNRLRAMPFFQVVSIFELDDVAKLRHIENTLIYYLRGIRCESWNDFRFHSKEVFSSSCPNKVLKTFCCYVKEIHNPSKDLYDDSCYVD